MRNFIGRNVDLAALEAAGRDGNTKLLCLYGRRRVGKSELIRQFVRDKPCLVFEAVEGGDTPEQIRHFLGQLALQCNEPHLAHLVYDRWPPVFDLLTQKIAAYKNLVLAFDELSWMAAGRTQLVGYIKYYWDRFWKYRPRLVFILCGSLASWMIKNVVRSRALYGRISESLLLEPLKPRYVAEFVGKKRGAREVLEYLLCFGGIPRYLEEFDFNASIALNINRTCFTRGGFFTDEADKIFFNQFHETRLYWRIVAALMVRGMALKGIAVAVDLPSGGGLKTYLDNLAAAGIIVDLPILNNFHALKHRRYTVCDEFLLFDKSFIAPHRDEIRHNATGDKFAKFTQGSWEAFLGAAFERFCVKFRFDIAAKLAIDGRVTACGPVFQPGKNGYQYDLVYLRKDHTITVCEVKYLGTSPGTGLIREMQDKIARTDFPRGVSVEKILIVNRPPSRPLVESGYFNRILTAAEILET